MDRQAKGFAAGRQRDLGETSARHDGLAVNLVIVQPRVQLGADVGLPYMRTARRQFDMHAQQRVGTGELPSRRAVGDPVLRMEPRRRRNIGEPARAAGQRGHPVRPAAETAASCVWKVSVSGLSRFTVAATWISLRGVTERQGLGDGVGEQRMRADLDERAVVGAGSAPRPG